MPAVYDPADPQVVALASEIGDSTGAYGRIAVGGLFLGMLLLVVVLSALSHDGVTVAPFAGYWGTELVLGRRRAPDLDPQLLDRVAAGDEVQLGTFPDAVLALCGAHPVRTAFDQGTTDVAGTSAAPESPFGRLVGAGRRAALQAALDELTATGILALPSDISVDRVVSAGLRGKLAPAGDLGTLHRICTDLHQHGYPAAMMLGMAVIHAPASSERTSATVRENGYCLDTARERVPVMLVERADLAAGGRSFALRTAPAQLDRAGDLLFAADPGPYGSPFVQAQLLFRARNHFVDIELRLGRQPGTPQAVGTAAFHGRTGAGVKRGRKQPGDGGSDEGEQTISVDAEQFRDLVRDMFKNGWEAAC